MWDRVRFYLADSSEFADLAARQRRCPLGQIHLEWVNGVEFCVLFALIGKYLRVFLCELHGRGGNAVVKPVSSLARLTAPVLWVEIRCDADFMI